MDYYSTDRQLARANIHTFDDDHTIEVFISCLKTVQTTAKLEGYTDVHVECNYEDDYGSIIVKIEVTGLRLENDKEYNARLTANKSSLERVLVNEEAFMQKRKENLDKLEKIETALKGINKGE